MNELSVNQKKLKEQGWWFKSIVYINGHLNKWSFKFLGFFVVDLLI